jgi:hypothetical protein
MHEASDGQSEKDRSRALRVRRRLGRAIAAGVAAGALLATSAARAQVDVSESFDTDLGAFDTVFGTQADGFDVGWSDTAFAGGAPGELGGTFVRLNSQFGDLSMPRVLDTESFAAPIDLNQPFEASGSMFLDDVSDSAALDVNLGFFRENNPTGERIVIRIQPNGGNEWRFRMGVNTSSGTRLDAPLAFDSVPLTWSFAWTPSGLGNGTGTAVGAVSDGVTTLELPTPSAFANTAQLDAFGVWANSANTTDPARVQRMFFDDFVYHVPEPGPAGLGAVAVGMALVLRRKP